ncbi:MAG: hypothetical protein ABJB03_00210 [Rhodoglobus sp.]
MAGLRTATRRRIAAIAVAIVALSSLWAVSPVAESPANAVDGAQFNAGNIISDSLFFDGSAMTEDQIQSFLDSKIGGCQNSLCLNVLRVNTPNEAAQYTGGTLVCGAYSGAANERASTVIYKVQKACNISAKVLLVILQKEQGLVTRTAPSASTLERAMGYGCPDNTGGTCASQYYGFYNQMINAAWQLRRYGTSPVFGNYQPGVNTVAWNPDPNCGASTFTIVNRATAALYNYTPYRPNAAALSNLYGTGDDCSSYGNRNFWAYYSDWFGNTTAPPGTPEGGGVTITPIPSNIAVSGYAVDPDAVTAFVPVAVQIDSSWYGTVANLAGASREPEYPGAGSNHDFGGSYPASPGHHTVCIYLVNAGGAGGQGSLGCQDVIVPFSPAPVGAINAATANGRVVAFSGWAVQPDQPTSAVPIAINYGAQWIPLSANQPNSTAPTQVKGAGPNQGFSGTFIAEPGVQTFCAWAARPTGPAVRLGCRSLLVPDVDLTLGKVTGATGAAASLSMSGWAVWPDAPTSAVPIALNIGNSWYAASADLANPAGEAAVPGAGPNHGFTATAAVRPGTYNACIWAAQLKSAAKMLGCRTVSVAAPAATSSAIESVTTNSSGVVFSGWAVWPSDLAASVPIAANIGSSWYGFSASQPSPTGDAANPGAGPNHGFVGSILVPPGNYTVCFWAGSPGGAPATQIGCETVKKDAPTGAVGELTSVESGAGGLHYSGWAVLASAPATPVVLALDVDGAWSAITTDEPNEVAPTKFSGAGSNQGTSGFIATAPGVHNVCLWAQSPVGAVNLGCSTVTVVAASAVFGRITEVTASAGAITIKGFAAWPSAPTTSVPIAANIGSSWFVIPSAVPSTVTADWIAGAGPNQGLNGSFPAPPGEQNVCLWAATPNGPAVQLGCSVVTVP